MFFLNVIHHVIYSSLSKVSCQNIVCLSNAYYLGLLFSFPKIHDSHTDSCARRSSIPL